MLTNDNKIMLIDFGVSQKLKKVLKEDDYLLGTAFYQAPEKFTTNRIDKRTDIFGIGVILYTAITGKVLTEFQHFSLPSVRKVNPKASKHIERIISKCIEFHPEDRYQCIDDLLKELNKANKGFQKHNHSTLLKTILLKHIRP
jgi:serine/threonine-protein kinase